MAAMMIMVMNRPMWASNTFWRSTAAALGPGARSVGRPTYQLVMFIPTYRERDRDTELDIACGPRTRSGAVCLGPGAKSLSNIHTHLYTEKLRENYQCL